MLKNGGLLDLEKFENEITEAYQASLILRELDGSMLHNDLSKKLYATLIQSQRNLIDKLCDEISIKKDDK